MVEFTYHDLFPHSKDETRYRLVTSAYISTTRLDGEEVLKVDPEGLTVLAREAMRDAEFLLRTDHLEQVAAILDDPEASDNDRGVALALLRNAEVAAAGRAADVPGHRHGDRHRQERRPRLDRRAGRGGPVARHLRDLY